jgi:arylsulfatase A-like enzyme
VKRIATTSHFSVPGEVRKRRANLELRKATIARSATRMAGEVLTLAEALGRAGYATGHFGKWHLGSEPYSPLEQGFDVDIPHWSGGGPPGSYIAPWNFPKESKFTARSPSEHLEDRMVQEAIAFMKQHKDRPFFLNYWAFSTHTPLNAKRELVDKYAEKVHRSNPQHNPVYAAMVESFDEAVGKLLDAVDELGVAERTIIVFYSDNGGSTYAHSNGVPATSNAPLRGGKSSIYEGGIKVPAAVIWPGHIDPGSKSDAFLSSADWYPTLLEMLEIEKTSGQLFDGVSQVPAFLGKSAPRSSIYSFFPHYTPRTGTIPATSIRKEHWKLIRFHHAGDKQEDRFELYNLDDDIGESKNLAEVYPDRVESLNNEISSYLRNIGALVPVPNANYKHAEDR